MWHIDLKGQEWEPGNQLEVEVEEMVVTSGSGGDGRSGQIQQLFLKVEMSGLAVGVRCPGFGHQRTMDGGIHGHGEDWENAFRERQTLELSSKLYSVRHPRVDI